MRSTTAFISALTAGANVALGATSCPQLSSNYEVPHLIVPVSQSNFDTTYGTVFSPVITSDKSSIFNFDIPATDAGKVCILTFLLPAAEAAYQLTGDGMVIFNQLATTATQQTTYSNMGATANLLWPNSGSVSISPGSQVYYASFDCPAGETVSIEMSAAPGSDTNFTFFQHDTIACPIGLYIEVVA